MALLFFRFLFCFLFAAGWGVAQTSSLINTQFSDKPLLSRTNIALNPAVNEQIVDSSYILGPGDFLDLFLEDNYLSLQIYPDGSIVIDECGVVQAAGKTLAQVRDEVLKLVEGRYNPQYCFIQLVQLKKFRVNVMGAVSTVGQHLVEPQTRLSLLIRQVGGLLASADDRNIVVIRQGDSLRVDFYAVTTEGDFSKDIMLEQGDQIFVPFTDVRSHVTLIFPGYRVAVSYKENQTVKGYYDFAGGSRMHNQGYQSIVIQEPGQKSFTVPFAQIDSIYPAPNAQITFTVQSLFVYVGGAVMQTGKIPYDPSWKAIDYIAAAGVSITTGSWDRVHVIRGDREKLDVNATQDVIMPGDYIEIPRSVYESFKDITLFLASLLTVISSALIIYVNYK